MAEAGARGSPEQVEANEASAASDGAASPARTTGAGDATGASGAARAGNKFDRDTAVTLEERSAPESLFAAVVSPDWRAGRGPHGGYLAAMLLRALRESVAEPGRAPRSLTIHYARAPEPGPVLIRTVLERAGRSLSTLSARMEQDGRLTALALAAFSVPWTGTEIADEPMPAVEPPQPLRGNPEPLHPALPPIAGRTRLQQRFGGHPFSGEQQPMEIGGWLAHAEQRPIDALSLAFFADAVIPAPFMRLSEPSAAPTIDLSVHFRAALPPATDEELCLLRIRTGLIHEGFFEEDGWIWSPDGRLLAQSRQLALLMPLKMG